MRRHSAPAEAPAARRAPATVDAFLCVLYVIFICCTYMLYVFFMYFFVMSRRRRQPPRHAAGEPQPPREPHPGAAPGGGRERGRESERERARQRARQRQRQRQREGGSGARMRGGGSPRSVVAPRLGGFARASGRCEALRAAGVNPFERPAPAVATPPPPPPPAP